MTGHSIFSFNTGKRNIGILFEAFVKTFANAVVSVYSPSFFLLSTFFLIAFILALSGALFALVFPIFPR